MARQTPQSISKVAFMDGVVVDDIVHVFVAGDLQSGNFDFTRLFVLRTDDQWYHWNFESVIVSVCALVKPQRQYFALGRDGKVFHMIAGSDPVEERIKDAGTGRGKRGYVIRIRDIAGDVYVCGDEGQVYRRTPNGWVHVDAGVLETKEKEAPNCHNGIDGTARDDLYVVGEHGRIFHYNGSRWRRVGFQTNHHLESIRAVSRDEVYVCGANGLLLKGNSQGFRFIGDPEMTGHIWDLELFDGKIYLAVEDTLMVYDGSSIDVVNTGLEPPPGAHRLSARGGVLWSFGEHDIAFTNGVRWTRVAHPDNV